ncbi:hypothetical protein LTR95_011871 [Oleoguttula sp. CCFEE 5521]
MATLRKINPSVSPPDAMTQETQSQTSQDLDMSAMQGVKARRRNREDAIHQAHEARMDSMWQKLEAAVQRDEEQFHARRLPQVQRLCELVQKKRKLEDAILSSKAELDCVVETAVQNLQIGIEKRTEDLNA